MAGRDWKAFFAALSLREGKKGVANVSDRDGHCVFLAFIRTTMLVTCTTWNYNWISSSIEMTNSYFIIRKMLIIE
ncbi:MAG TPA: hypothetical protein DDW27_08190 [Bacteroidales bacterium]|nr:hypothetical protein [Bacteroidales bacterium]